MVGLHWEKKVKEAAVNIPNNRGKKNITRRKKERKARQTRRLEEMEQYKQAGSEPSRTEVGCLSSDLICML